MLQELRRRGIMVLVTSRRSLGANLGRASQLRLGALSAEAGAELLVDLAGTGVDWGTGEAEQAGAHLRRQPAGHKNPGRLPEWPAMHTQGVQH